MKVELNTAIPVSEQQINTFEQSLGSVLPPKFRQFVKQFNGVEPSENSYDDDVNARYFIPIDQILERRNRLYDISESSIPIAVSEGGCYILLKLDDDTIWFWDREFPEIRKQLATDVYDFLEKLHPDDPSTLEVPEGTKVIHFDPEFREEQRRLGNRGPDKKSTH